MKQVFLLLCITLSVQSAVNAQRIGQVPDSLRKKNQANNQRVIPKENTAGAKLDQDSLIRIKLVALAQGGTNIVQADANIRMAQANLDFAKKSWLSSVTAGANINEFVVNSSPLANFFPKYNLGISIPFDIVARVKREKRLAQENLLINEQTKKEKMQLIRTEVLIKYENYKEKKELVLIQKNSLEYDYSSYLAIQKSYADGDATLEAMDKAYQSYLGEKVKLLSKESDLRISVLQLEQLIGIALNDAIEQALK